MGLTLNLDGFIKDFKEEPQSETERNRKKNAARKPIGLDFTNLQRPYADALVYWQEKKLATPLIWMLFDYLGSSVDKADPTKQIPFEEILLSKDPDEFARNLMEFLREKHKDSLKKMK
ncbi:hypothetical protein HLH17_14415 [Acinetobacter sp. ANC 5380]|uniref:Uncharacterized protein n=1 Tax=Acinetobacter terrae TaxID=2731247 RepID=A0A7Y2WBY6_9GAMM|nr:hypothetical protein [Acinetobacter terrae]NNH78815.1 hypothetical protein [Acinetobacter terrae]